MPEWLDNLQNEELKSNETLSQLPDIETLAKSYIDAQSMVGGSVRIPGENAGQEDWDAFNKKMMDKVPTLMSRPDLENAEQMQQVFEMLGRPKDANGYELEADESMLSAFHAQGLSKAQAKGLANHFSEVNTQTSAEQEAKIKEGMGELANEWGYAFDQRMATAVAVLKKTGAPASLVDAAETGKVGADTMRWAYNVGASIGGENPNFANDGKGGNNAQMTPSEARSQINEINANKDHPYWKGDKNAISTMLDLQRAANAK